MNLNQRVRKIEREVLPDVKTEERESDPLRLYARSPEFYAEIHAQAWEILATMNALYIPAVLDYWQQVQEIDDFRDWRKYPERESCKGVLAWLIADMIDGKINGYYIGPMSVPDAIAEAWLNSRNWRTSLYWNCGNCAYSLPSPRICKAHSCAFCGGHVCWENAKRARGIDRALWSVHKKDSEGYTVIDDYLIIQILGALLRHGAFDSFKVQSAPDEVLM